MTTQVRYDALTSRKAFHRPQASTRLVKHARKTKDIIQNIAKQSIQSIPDTHIQGINKCESNRGEKNATCER